MGTLTFLDGSVLPLDSFRDVRGAGILYLRVKASITELGIFENESAAQIMKCDADGVSKTYRGYTEIVDIVKEDNGIVRVGMERRYD